MLRLLAWDHIWRLIYSHVKHVPNSWRTVRLTKVHPLEITRIIRETRVKHGKMLMTISNQKSRLAPRAGGVLLSALCSIPFLTLRALPWIPQG